MEGLQKVTCIAPAKINLALDVIGVRPNGYHDVRMVMQSIRLSDTVSISRKETPGIAFSINLGTLPSGKGNIAYDAAELFLKEQNIAEGVSITVEKSIPVAAGLAGGSTDAAAVLRGLNELFGTGLSEEQLRTMGLKLGADVPYCIMGGTALAEGIGEILTKLPDAPHYHVLLVKPDCGVSTKEIYSRLQLDDTTRHPDIGGMLRAVGAGNHLGVAEKMGNVLEPVTVALCPEIAEIERQMRSFGGEGVMMSGSGPTVFGLFADKGRATAAYMHFRVGRYARQTYLTEFCKGAQ